MNKSSLAQALKKNLGLYIALLSVIALFLIRIVLSKANLIYFPLFRFHDGITSIFMIAIAVLAALLFVLVTSKMSAPITFAFLCLSAIVLTLYLLNSPLRYILMIYGSVLVIFAAFPATYRYRWLYLFAAMLFISGVISLFWFYFKPAVYTLLIGSVLISTAYVFWPKKLVQLAASIWTLVFPSLVLFFLLNLSSNRFYLIDEEYASFDLVSPLSTEVKVTMTLEEAMIDQYLNIRVYKPVGLGLYSLIGATYFEYYASLDFTVDDFVWELDEHQQYQLVVKDDLASVFVNL